MNAKNVKTYKQVNPEIRFAHANILPNPWGTCKKNKHSQQLKSYKKHPKHNGHTISDDFRQTRTTSRNDPVPTVPGERATGFPLDETSFPEIGRPKFCSLVRRSSLCISPVLQTRFCVDKSAALVFSNSATTSCDGAGLATHHEPLEIENTLDRADGFGKQPRLRKGLNFKKCFRMFWICLES